MKHRHRDYMLGLLQDWEKYPDEYCRFLKPIAEGASVTERCRQFMLTGNLFYSWVESDPERHRQYKEALAARERLKLEQKALKRQETIERNKAVKLYFQIQEASQEAWESACRLLKISPVPTRLKR